MTHKTLLLAYGNPDREDDGSSWHVLAATAQRLGRAFPAAPEEEILPTPPPSRPGKGAGGIGEVDFHYSLQLMPEMAEMLAEYERVCFVDTHTGSISEPLHWEEVPAQYQNSPLSHHLTPATCLALTRTLYGRQPQAALLSLRGYQFGFARGLSPATQALVPQAADKILTWLS